MATTASKLTFEQFQAQYSQIDGVYEFWYGEAIPKPMPTWVQALLQKIIERLLDEKGFISGAEVELRIVRDAHPRPDVIAVTAIPSGRIKPKAPLLWWRLFRKTTEFSTCARSAAAIKSGAVAESMR